jgi:arsenate reductase
MATTLYGIPNCDQVRKARVWLDANDIAYTFHDFKKSGISRALVTTWTAAVQWDVLVNRKGTTWRALSDARKASINNAESAMQLMLESPSIIKRPVLVSGSGIHVGFSDELYQQIFRN